MSAQDSQDSYFDSLGLSGTLNDRMQAYWRLASEGAIPGGGGGSPANGVTVPDLSDASALAGTDYLVVSQGGTLYKLALSVLSTYLGATGGGGGNTPSPTGYAITVNTPSAQAVGVAFNVTGTYSNGTPTSLAYSLDNSTWTTATGATISGGTYSFSITISSANASQRVYVRDVSNTAVSGFSGTFTVSAASVSYTLTRYSNGQPANTATGNALTRASTNSGTFANSSTGVNYIAFNGLVGINEQYWGVAPEPTKVYMGWGTSSTTPPPQLADGTSINSDGFKVSTGAMMLANPDSTFAGGRYFDYTGFLWVRDQAGTFNWYFWIKPIDGAAVCVNASSPCVVTLS